jgi:hypothetical protein
MIKDQGERIRTKEGAQRDSSEGRGRFDLLPFEAMETLAIWFEKGAARYGDRDWEKGSSVKDSINRMIRHSLKAGSGWTDEDHLSAVMWNAACAITMMKRRPDCDDHTWVIDKDIIVEPTKCLECGVKIVNSKLHYCDSCYELVLEGGLPPGINLDCQRCGHKVDSCEDPYCTKCYDLLMTDKSSPLCRALVETLVSLNSRLSNIGYSELPTDEFVDTFKKLFNKTTKKEK